MLILQYILNLEAANTFKYEGSGTIQISGTAQFSFTANFETYLQKHYVGEYVYDLNGNVWQIVAIQGTPENPVYIVQSNDQIRSFFENEIISLHNASQYFNAKYDAKISEYESIIQQLNNLYNNL